jgi:hypothetical protein
VRIFHFPINIYDRIKIYNESNIIYKKFIGINFKAILQILLIFQSQI